MEKQFFGKLPTGEEVYAYTLINSVASVTFITRGATITDFTVFGTSIVGGFADLETYLLDTSHQGAIIGRVANRIGNASFTMDGKTYEVPKNNLGKHCLHGGAVGASVHLRDEAHCDTFILGIGVDDAQHGGVQGR